MRKQVWKYIINPNQESYNIPIGSEILSVQSQNGNICIWVLVIPENKTEYRYFEVFGTGHDINYNMGTEKKYIGTTQLLNQGLVLHLFERIY